jgi:hypothetical protein
VTSSDDVAAGFAAISLRELEERAMLQVRRDRRYVLDWPAFGELARALAPEHAALDIDGRRVFSYETVYFDTPGFDCYRAHVQGRRRRFKARSRCYVDSARCVFEVKLRGGDEQTVKAMLPYRPADHGSLTADAYAFLREQLRSAHRRDLTVALTPALATRYRRMTLVHRELGERLTCDIELLFVSARGEGRIRTGHVVVETKTAGEAGSADRALWRLGLRPLAGGSKFCLGTALSYPELGDNRFRRTLRSYFASWSAVGAEPPLGRR